MRKVLLFPLIGLSLVFAHIVKPGDVLTVDVYFQSGEVISRTVKVDYNGKASLPYIGCVEVAGRDLEYVRNIIQKKADEFLPSSIVVVYLSQPRRELVYFHGIITGAYDISQLPPKMRRLSSVMAMVAGEGVRGSPERVKIIRNGKVIDVDFERFLRTGDEDFDPVLEGGDVIYTPRPDYVGVFGNVVESGTYEVREGENLLELLSVAGLKVSPSQLKSIKVYRGSEAHVFKGNDLEEMRNFVIEGGDMVSVEVFDRVEVYLVGDVSKKLSLSERDKPTLRSVLSMAEIRFKGEEWSVKLVRDDEAKEFSVRNPEGIPDIPLKDGDLIVIRKLPEYVYLRGIASGRFDISEIPKESRRLSLVLSTIGVSERVKSVRIVRESGELIVFKEESGMWSDDPVLSGGDVLILEGPARVVVQGDGVKQGLYEIETGESLLEVLSRAGAALGDLKLVKIIRDGTEVILENPSASELSRIFVEDGDVVQTVGYEKVNVYVGGVVSGRLTFSERESPDLRKVLASVGLNFNGASFKVELHRGEEAWVFNIAKPSEIPEVNVEDGDLVFIEMENPPVVYLGGIRNGKLTFQSEEEMTLKRVLYETGTTDGVVFLTRGSSTVWYDVEDILLDGSDVQLENGDFLYITTQAFGSVLIVGKGTVKVGLKRPTEGLRDLLLRNGFMPSPDDLKEIRLIKGSGEIDVGVSDLVSGKTNPQVEDGDIVLLVPKRDRILYVNGDLGRVLVFSGDEVMDRKTVMAKLGLGEDSVLDIRGEFRDGGTIWVRLRKPIRVMAYGEDFGVSEVAFQSNEIPSILSLLSKLHLALRDGKSYRVEVLRRGKGVFSTEVSSESSPSELDFVLEDGDFVRVIDLSIVVSVFGSGVRQGRYVLPRGSTLEDLLSVSGGFPSGISGVEILRNGSSTVVKLKPEIVRDFTLESGDVLIFKSERDDFVYVIGDVSRPGAVFVGDGEKLIKVLSLSGGLSGWESKRRIEIIRDGKVLELELDQKKLMEIEVRGGDVVYVVPRTFNRVYVLGAVVRPSVVPVDRETTLLDAIMRAGGFSKNAVRDRIYVFRGGVNGPVEVYDMGWVSGSGRGRNPKLQPGDVVYVPDNPFVSINEMISLITPMMSFLNNSINLYKNVKGLW